MVKKGETLANRSSESFDASYDATPPWDIGRPQREVVKLAEDGWLRGEVLDIGCGTGENALYLADLGYHVEGVDASPKAIAKARQKSQAQDRKVRFEVGDALHLEKLGKTYDSALDCGLFHVFSDEDRALYIQSVHRVLKPGGRYFILCFSDREPGQWGPRRVSKAELEEAFRQGWKIETLREALFETNFDDPLVEAWLVLLEKI